MSGSFVTETRVVRAIDNEQLETNLEPGLAMWWGDPGCSSRSLPLFVVSLNTPSIVPTDTPSRHQVATEADDGDIGFTCACSRDVWK